MHIRMQFDKRIPQSEESLSVYISNGDKGYVDLSFDDVRAAINYFSALFDKRLENLNRIIVAEGNFRESMTDEQETSFNTAFDLLYPSDMHRFDERLAGQRNIRVQIAKETGPGEALTLQLGDFTSNECIALDVIEAFELIDMRLISENKKILEHNTFVNTLPMDTQLAIQPVFDVLFGRADVAQTVIRLKGYYEELLERKREEEMLGNGVMDTSTVPTGEDLNASAY